MKKYKRHGKQYNIFKLGGILILIIAAGVMWQVNHRDTEIWSWTLGSKTVVIDAGHGGPDPGAVGKTGILEKDVTLEVSKRLKALIMQGGANPIMVREEDVDLGTSEGLLKRKREDLAQRLQLALDSKADVYLSIHANSFPKESLTGPQVFYFSDSPEGKILAKSIQQSLNEAAGGKRVAKSNKDLFILKKVSQAAVTIEVGFLSNPGEEQLLNDPSYQQKLAWAIYQGLCQYFTEVTKLPAETK